MNRLLWLTPPKLTDIEGKAFDVSKQREMVSQWMAERESRSGICAVCNGLVDTAKLRWSRECEHCGSAIRP